MMATVLETYVLARLISAEAKLPGTISTSSLGIFASVVVELHQATRRPVEGEARLGACWKPHMVDYGTITDIL